MAGVNLEPEAGACLDRACTLWERTGFLVKWKVVKDSEMV